jgi:tetratricopeptide (TPR) repeat protein
MQLSQPEKADEQYRAALALFRKLAGEAARGQDCRDDLATTLNNRGMLLAEQERTKESAEHYREALVLRQQLAGDFHGVSGYRQSLVGVHINLGNLLARQDRGEEAVDQYQQALVIQKKLADEFPAEPAYRDFLANAHNNLGILHKNHHQAAKAAEQFRKALDIRQQLADEFPSVPDYQVALGGSCCNYASLLRESGKPADSLPWLDRAIRTLTRVHQQDPRAASARLFLRNSHWVRALTRAQMEKHAEAIKDWDLARELSPANEHARFRAYRADSRVRAGQQAEAVSEVAELTKSSNWSAFDWYNFARICAVASGKSADRKKEYADRAMALLRRAVQAGYQDVSRMAEDRDLDALHGRDDFKKLFGSLAKPKEPAPAGKRLP